MSCLNVGDFNIRNLIGKGTFAKVFLMEKKDTGEVYAVKTVEKSSVAEYDMEAGFKTEKAILLNSDFPFIVKGRGFFENNTHMFFVMDFM